MLAHQVGFSPETPESRQSPKSSLVYTPGSICQSIMNKKIKEILRKILEIEEISVFIPEHESQGHYSTNIAMRLAKELKRSPMEIAREFAEKIKNGAPPAFFYKVEVAPPGFINFWLASQAIQKEFSEVCKNLKSFGYSDIGHGKTVIVEYSQPNIAKKMHVGHLRTTIIGDTLANILECLGYKVVRWNYLGDWGTQFGKLIAAYKLWGDEKAVEADPINELQKIYVRFHDELESKPELNARGQEEFRKLEEGGDKENRKLWEWFKKESLKEFEKTYEVLDVKFDMDIGESFYEKDIKPLIARLVKGGIVKESEGALVILLEKRDLPPALIRKSDGASLYLTRDIANFEYRVKKYRPAKILYVVGNEQSLHFEQLFAVAALLGLSEKTDLIHVKYGLVLGEEGKKLATREGRAILLDEVLGRAIQLAKDIVAKKATISHGVGGVEKKQIKTEIEQEEIARVVGVGALKYGILKENRNTDITFNWAKMLDFAGDSAPYLQYTYARLRSIARKSQIANRKWFWKPKVDFSQLKQETELRVIRKIFEFPEEVARSGEVLETNNLANYLYELASLVSRLYETTPVLKEESASRRSALLALIDASASVLKSGLGILGIKAPEKI